MGMIAGDPPAALTPSRSESHARRIRTRGIAPWHQGRWDWKAAANFPCGGAGTGLFTFAAVAGDHRCAGLAPGFIALVVIALGLNLPIFKIGRPLRFIYVLIAFGFVVPTVEAIAFALAGLSILSTGGAAKFIIIRHAGLF